MVAALTDVPSVSIVTPSTIVNGTDVGCSFEFIPPTGIGSHEDGGVEHFGGAFTNFAKKSFRVKFKAQYPASSPTTHADGNLRRASTNSNSAAARTT
jgi:hypothetical protein